MEIFRELDKIPQFKDSVVTIGTFDGCHRGHQDIIKKVIYNSEINGSNSILVTFEPHPRHVLQPEVKLPILMHIDRKLDFLKSFNLNAVVVIPFDEQFSKMTANNFLKNIILKQLNASKIIVGYDHHFGFNRDGSPDFLKNESSDSNFEVEIVEPISDQEMIISSTHIRQSIQNGYVRRASFELGWVFGFEAKVVTGSGRGKELGFPTANFIPIEKNQLIPANGVYCIRGRINGNSLYGMCNLGVRPTFDETDFVMEVHFFQNEVDDIYSKIITVEFLERVRDEKKFSNPKELIKQLEKDKEICMRLIQKYN
ncbi:MAG: riboflavin biosynthesis protein RibF [Candidatus Marinimicrobia bacterium]|jgi:riboflavin kinase/FMN adenylyltransferase|nr:riboflavin biosynthesis protein RibF [Candidatus Neomarinimicrobiota bacterium]|tara:strand:+ start:1263 stop:2198 length:936 start_codon:yes stop_codon:yes gene_type:complete